MRRKQLICSLALATCLATTACGAKPEETSQSIISLLENGDFDAAEELYEKKVEGKEKAEEVFGDFLEDYVDDVIKAYKENEMDYETTTKNLKTAKSLGMKASFIKEMLTTLEAMEADKEVERAAKKDLSDGKYFDAVSKYQSIKNSTSGGVVKIDEKIEECYKAAIKDAQSQVDKAANFNDLKAACFTIEKYMDRIPRSSVAYKDIHGVYANYLAKYGDLCVEAEQFADALIYYKDAYWNEFQKNKDAVDEKIEKCYRTYVDKLKAQFDAITTLSEVEAFEKDLKIAQNTIPSTALSYADLEKLSEAYQEKKGTFYIIDLETAFKKASTIDELKDVLSMLPKVKKTVGESHPEYKRIETVEKDTNDKIYSVYLADMDMALKSISSVDDVKAAKTLVDQAKSYYKKDAEKYEKVSEYTEKWADASYDYAKKLFDKAVEEHDFDSIDEPFKQLRNACSDIRTKLDELLNDKKVLKVIYEATEQAKENKYTEAIKVLTDSKLKDDRITDKISEFQKQYETYLLEKAYELANKKDYDAAYDCCQEGLEQFSSIPLETLSKICYSNFRYYGLDNVAVIQNSENINHNKYSKDWFGHDYATSYTLASGKISYVNNKRFTRFSGTVATPEGIQSDSYRSNSTLIIYGDNEEIARFENFNGKHDPVAFDLDISKYMYISLEVTCEGSNVWKNWGYFTTIFDPKLTLTTLELPTLEELKKLGEPEPEDIMCLEKLKPANSSAEYLTNKADRDYFGNQYHRSYYVKGGSLEYVLNREYSTFSGVVATPLNKQYDNNRTTATLKIYGDDELLGTFEDFNGYDVPTSFSYDVSTVRILRLEVTCKGNNAWKDWGYFTTIFDNRLEPVKAE